MVTLKGNNLGKRQKELNEKVIETVAKNVDFNEVKSQSNASDVNMLYTIDVASKYKNIDYIIEVLKGGDSLYISRAIKSTWLYDNEFSNVINTDYLHLNLFPLMSNRMKTKFLTTISKHVRDDNRAASFYTYCKNLKMYNIALKFLLFTSESYKLDVIKQSSTMLDKISAQEDDYISFFVGDSFDLASAYLNSLDKCDQTHKVLKLIHLLSVSDTKYLDYIEKYLDISQASILGLRTSKHILTKHKGRCLENPKLYMNLLNKSSIAKYLTTDEAKNVLVNLLPSEYVEDYWNGDFCKIYEYIVNVIPANEKFEYIKSIFNNKYPDKEFEMTYNFYSNEYYRFMTVEEREAWALRHLNSKKEILSPGSEYIWYKFINFDVAFPEIKKYIYKTTNFWLRSNIIKVLIQSARNQREVERLLTYHQDRHMNEVKHAKQSFIMELMKHHNIFEFDHECWNVFNQTLYSLDIYNIRGGRCAVLTFAALIYHLIHKIDVPDSLIDYIDTELSWYGVKDQLLSKISEENQHVVYEYLLAHYVRKMEELVDKNEESDVNQKTKFAACTVSLLEEYNKKVEDCPEIVLDYINNNMDTFKYYSMFRGMTDIHLMRYLKQDTKTVLEKIPLVRKTLSNDYYFFLKIITFLKKIKIYFTNDIAQEYFNMFIEMSKQTDLSRNNMISVIYGLFQLGDEKFKEEFMMKYAPKEYKIDHTKMDTQTFYIQQGICRSAGFSRPPVPLSNILTYIRGDYLQYCLPIFNIYLANLTLPNCIKFVEAILQSRVSVQKHGIRLAFRSFSVKNLKILVNDIWKKTKNVSLRLVIYQKLCNKIIEDETARLELFGTLKSFTLDLHEDDDKEIFNLLTSNKLPEDLLPEYIQATWKTVDKLAFKSANIQRKTPVISNIERRISILDATFVKSIVEKHITDQLDKAGIRVNYEIEELTYLYEAKWKLAAAYIVYHAGDKNLLQENVNLTKSIIKKCIEMWNVVHDEIFTLRQFCWEFIDFLVNNSTYKGNYEDTIPIFEAVLSVLQESLSVRVIYLVSWRLQLMILNRRILDAAKFKFNQEEDKSNKKIVVKETIEKYGREVSNLIKESVEKNEYFRTYVEDVRIMISSNISDIKNHINNECCVDMATEELYLAVSPGLLEVDIPDTYLMVLHMLSVHSTKLWDEEYQSILKKIKAYKNDEVQCYLYRKFVSSDFRDRKLSL